eukprot:Lithocolla_globosa_v1_NODE_1502_length_2528_cov_32.357461.p3 type:complete len:109 gc:universal NODE_1502_length_2528_cov_32.357461:400-726(+)
MTTESELPIRVKMLGNVVRGIVELVATTEQPSQFFFGEFWKIKQLDCINVRLYSRYSSAQTLFSFFGRNQNQLPLGPEHDWFPSPNPAFRRRSLHRRPCLWPSRRRIC